MFARDRRGVRGGRVPLAHERHDFQFGLFGRDREQHGAVQEIEPEGRAVIGAPDTGHGCFQIAVIEQIADEQLGAGALERDRPLVPASDEGAYRKAALEQLRNGGRAGAAEVTRILGLVMVCLLVGLRLFSCFM